MSLELIDAFYFWVLSEKGLHGVTSNKKRKKTHYGASWNHRFISYSVNECNHTFPGSCKDSLKKSKGVCKLKK